MAEEFRSHIVPSVHICRRASGRQQADTIFFFFLFIFFFYHIKRYNIDTNNIVIVQASGEVFSTYFPSSFNIFQIFHKVKNYT